MFHILNRLEVGIIATLLVLTTLLVVIEVVLRFMFGFGFMWLQELTLHIAAWFVLFGASYGVKVGAHIQVDTVVNALSKGPKRIAGVIALTSGLIYCGLVLYGGWDYLSKIKKMNIELQDLPFSKWIAQSVLIIGFVLLAIRLMKLLWSTLKGGEPGFHVVSEAKEVLEEFNAPKTKELE